MSLAQQLSESAHTPELPPAESQLRRWYRAFLSSLGIPFFWLGKFCSPLLRKLQTPERHEQGLVLILPGVEGESFLNQSVAWGLADAGVPSALVVDDWTTGTPLLYLYHLRGWSRNKRQAQRIAERIVDYQNSYPGRPVDLIGHSGGGALVLLVLEALPPDRRVTSAVLLDASISCTYDLTRALPHTVQGIDNFHSRFDCLFLGFGTLLLGTMDGQYQISAGCCGFVPPAQPSETTARLYASSLHEHPFRWKMARSGHLGGHLGCVNRLFAAEWIAPLLKASRG